MTEREQLEMELLGLQIADLTAVLAAIQNFNELIIPHIPTVNRIGAESDNTLMRISSQMTMFEQELKRVKESLLARQSGTQPNSEVYQAGPAPVAY